MERFLTWDAAASNHLRVAEKPGLLRSLAKFFAHSGDSWFWLLGLLILGLAGSPYWRARAVVLGVGVLVTAVLVLVIKFSVRRRRPEGQWGNIYRSTDPHSFPSGHAARAMLLAVLAIGLGPAWFAILLLVWAPLVGLARVAMGVHYVSDVLAGWLLGALMGWLVYSLV
ncbi:MAG: phosphatase PAP2 family protein [Anaerolineales bacterium]|nr:phosphatase PAP2 family protein [Anaerolineales bacterium]